LEKKRGRKEQPFIVNGIAEGIGRFNYRIYALNSALAHVKTIERLQKENPKKLIKLIGQIHVEKEELNQQLILPLSKS